MCQDIEESSQKFIRDCSVLVNSSIIEINFCLLKILEDILESN